MFDCPSSGIYTRHNPVLATTLTPRLLVFTICGTSHIERRFRFEGDYSPSFRTNPLECHFPFEQLPEHGRHYNHSARWHTKSGTMES